MDELRKVPPVTLFLVGATLLVTVGPLLQLINPYLFLLWWPAILKRGQVWRIVTSFFLTGGGLQLIFDLFLLGRNSLDLEVNAYYRRTSEYAWTLLIVATLIVGTNYPLQSTVLFNPLLMALNYLWARNNPTASVSLFGLVSCPAPLLPYAYLLFDLLRGGPGMAVQSATGILAAHIYYYLQQVLPATDGGRGPRLLPPPPAFLRRLLPDSVDPANAAAQAQRDSGRSAAGGGRVLSTGWGGTAFAPRGREFGDGQTGWGGGPGGGGGSTGGQTIGSDGSASRGGASETSTGGWLSSLFNGGRSSGSSTSATKSGDSAEQRRALLEATERRLRAQRDNSIAGRHAAAAAAAGPSSSSSSSDSNMVQQGAAGRGTVGSTATNSASSASPSIRSRFATAGVSTASGATSSSHTSSRRQRRMDTDEENEDGEEQLDASGSGGSVAEQRWAEPSSSYGDRNTRSGRDSDRGTEANSTTHGGQGHQWGQGQRLGE
ncbi:unnamed protein product [Parajaminaea phylloscopi]